MVVKHPNATKVRPNLLFFIFCVCKHTIDGFIFRFTLVLGLVLLVLIVIQMHRENENKKTIFRTQHEISKKPVRVVQLRHTAVV